MLQASKVYDPYNQTKTKNPFVNPRFNVPYKSGSTIDHENFKDSPVMNKMNVLRPNTTNLDQLMSQHSPSRNKSIKDFDKQNIPQIIITDVKDYH